MSLKVIITEVSVKVHLKGDHKILASLLVLSLIIFTQKGWIVTLCFKYCLKNQQESIIRFVFKPDNTRLRFFERLQISDIDELILALIFRFGVILV